MAGSAGPTVKTQEQTDNKSNTELSRAPSEAADKQEQNAGSIALLLTSALAFSLIAADVFAPFSLHLLQPLDWQAHSWTLEHVPTNVSSVLAEKWLSDAALVSGLVGWWVACLTTVANQPKRGVPLTAAAVTFYLLCAGGVTRGDPPVVDFLKHAFHRARPSDLHHSFSFPSGHTTAASFIVGTLLLVLAPAAIDAVAAAGRSSKLAATSKATVARMAVPLWGLGIVATATGRVLGDVHWVSDTLAGACLGAAMVSLVGFVSRVLQRVQSR